MTISRDYPDRPILAASAAVVVGLQALLAGWLMRHADDADLLQLDTAPRLQRFVLVAMVNHANANQARPVMDALIDWTAGKDNR